MKMIPVTCPNCRANLNIAADRRMCFCEYCGTKVIIDDSQKTVIYRDEARLKELELYEKEQSRRKEETKRRIETLKKYRADFRKWLSNTVLGCIAVDCIIYLILGIMEGFSIGVNGGISIIAAILWFIVLPIRYIITMPEHPFNHYLKILYGVVVIIMNFLFVTTILTSIYQAFTN